MLTPLIERPRQVELPLGIQRQLRRPLVSMDATESLLDRVREEVMAEIEDGRIAWAWHLESSASRRRCVRVLADCVRYRIEGLDFPQKDEAEVITSIIPGHWHSVTVQELRRRWTVSSGLVRDLVKEGRLEFVPGTVCRPGSGGSPRITRESVAALLKSRRVS